MARNLDRLLVLVLAAAALTLSMACSSADPASGDEAPPAASTKGLDESPYILAQQFDLSISVTTTALRGSYSRLNKDHTCEGLDTSPPVSWEGVPANAKSLVLLFDDPASDELAGLGTWTHWVVYSIPPEVTEIVAAQPTSTLSAQGINLGKNAYGDIGYTGPCPTPTLVYQPSASGVLPGGRVGHTPPRVAEERPYYFRIYALDKEIDLESGPSRNVLLREIDGHIVGAGVAEVPFRSTKKIACRNLTCLSDLKR